MSGIVSDTETATATTTATTNWIITNRFIEFTSYINILMCPYIWQWGKPTDSPEFFAKVGYGHNNTLTNDSTILYKTILY